MQFRFAMRPFHPESLSHENEYTGLSSEATPSQSGLTVLNRMSIESGGSKVGQENSRQALQRQTWPPASIPVVSARILTLFSSGVKTLIVNIPNDIDSLSNNRL